jgi:VCBS repeat-containing protein
MTEYAHFVGRIGGLAAALGVGIALTVATPAVVHADTGSESSPTNDSTNTSSPSAISGTNPPAGTTGTPIGATELPNNNTTNASAPSGTNTSPTQPATAVQASSNGGSLNTAPQNAQSTPEVEPLTSVDPLTATGAPAAIELGSAPTTPTDTLPTPSTTATPTPNAVTAADPPPSTTNNANTTGNSKPTAAPLVQTTANPVAATNPWTTTARTTLALSSVSSSPTTSLSTTNVTAKSTALTATTNKVAALAPAATASTTAPTLISTVVTTIDGFLRGIVTAAMGLTGPGAPLDNPLAWTILAWTRRTFFNQAPTINPKQLTEDSEGVITGTLGALDADGDPLTYTITQKPIYGTVNLDANGNYTYTPDPEFAYTGGTDTFTVDVSDNTFDLTDLSTYPILNPNFHIHGPLFFLEPNNIASTVRVNLTIAPIDHAPTASPVTGETNQNTPKTVDNAVLQHVTDKDIQYGDWVMVQNWGSPNDYDNPSNIKTDTSKIGTYGSLTLSWDGSYTYTPDDRAKTIAQGKTGTDTFNYTVVDLDGKTSTSTITITITGLNDAPVSGPVSANTGQNIAIYVTADAGLLAPAHVTDADTGDSLIVANPGTYNGNYGVLIMNADGSLKYTRNAQGLNLPADGTPATDTFDYTVRDAAGAQSSNKLTINVDGLNDPLEAKALEIHAYQAIGGIYAPGVLKGVTDPYPGDILTVTNTDVQTSSLGNKLTLHADGSFVYVRNPNLNAASTYTETFTYTVHSQAFNKSVSSTLTVKGGIVTSLGWTDFGPADSIAGSANPNPTGTVQAQSASLIGNTPTPPSSQAPPAAKQPPPLPPRPTPPPTQAPPPTQTPPPPTRPAVTGNWSGGALPSFTLITLAPAAVAGTCTNGADSSTPQDANGALQSDAVDPRCTDQPIVNSPDNPHAGSPGPTPAPANGPTNEPTANSDPTGAHTQIPPFDLIAWLLGIDLPQPADPDGPMAPPPDPLNPAARAEGQLFDVFAVLDSVLGLNLLNDLPGLTHSIAPTNTPSDLLDAPTPGAP